MKNLSKLFVFFLAISFMSCSEDDSITDIADSNAPKTNVTIKATTTFGNTSGRFKSVNTLDIDAFYINIRKIEFEYANAGGDDDDQSYYNGEDEDINLTFDQLPQQIQDYINTNHPNDPFCKAEEEDDSDDPYKYEVELASGLELYFRADFTLYAQEQDDDPCNGSNGSTDDSSSYGDEEEFLLAGPFEINLLDQETTTIVNVDIPIGTYEEVEFEMDRSTDINSALYQKSIMISGKLNGTPMTFFHTFEEDFEVDYEDTGQNLVIDDSNNNEVTFNFDLNAVVNAVDFSNATDGNGDGSIEISPSDTDGNNALANQIKTAIVQFAELID